MTFFFFFFFFTPFPFLVKKGIFYFFLPSYLDTILLLFSRLVSVLSVSSALYFSCHCAEH